ncbi:MAG: hypothetical protein Q7W45_08630 [Bacteroidota bacterium]|nr:hypothetical protein [Bacteroidota bacterium]MDP3144257.1 hypothetical protein [Bacteroidota bacterium]MDP3558312.1 hypothetical protein [Bacteroidota bacterium]
MRTNTIYWLVLKFLLISFFSKAQLFSVKKADSLFESKAYTLAATEYERCYFFINNDTSRFNMVVKRANCFKANGDYFEAYKNLFRLLSNDLLTDSTRAQIWYECALNLYLSKYFNDAETYCLKIASLPVTNKYSINANLLHGLILNEKNDYFQANYKLIDFINLSDIEVSKKDSLKKIVASNYKKENYPKLKSLKKARKLSKILPGAGLFYAGKPGKALTNISLQLLAVGYTGLNVYIGNYFTSATAGVHLIRLFYTGGVNQLNEIVPLQNYNRSRKFNDNFKNTFLKELKQ